MENRGSLQTPPLPLWALESIYPFLGKPPPSGGPATPTPLLIQDSLLPTAWFCFLPKAKSLASSQLLDSLPALGTAGVLV